MTKHVYKTVTGLPDAIARREIIAGDRPADLVALGDAYRAAGWLSDALDCYERAGDRERVRTVKDLAVASEPFLLERLSLRLEVTREDWARAGAIARDAGRLTYAVRAFERAGDEAEVARLRERLDAFRAELRGPELGRGGGRLEEDDI